METYAEMGLRPLMNARQTLAASAECEGFELLGVDDFQGTPSFADAVAGMDSASVGVALAHQPNQATDALSVREGSIDVILSGHTHGGQTWPLHLISWSTNDNFAGLNDFEGISAYAAERSGARRAGRELYDYLDVLCLSFFSRWCLYFVRSVTADEQSR